VVRRSLLLAAVALTVIAPDAPAAPPPEATAFAAAIVKAQGAIDAQTEVLEGRVLRWRTDCPTNVPERRLGAVASLMLSEFFATALQPSHAPLRQALADLDAVATGDRVLRSGRAGWRVQVELMTTAPVVRDLCRKLRRWRAGEWGARGRPAGDLARIDRWSRELDLAGSVRKIERAAKRLRALGVPEADAEAFTGEGLFSKLDRVFDEDF
jgi:hypothetical protein